MSPPDVPAPSGPAGPVDPYDVEQVAAVLGDTLRLMGPAGVLDLLRRLPGTRPVPAVARRMFSPAVPEGMWIGPEHLVVLDEPVRHRHVVGGVVLADTPLPPGVLPGEVARLVAALTRSQGSAQDASGVLTAAREVLGRW